MCLDECIPEILQLNRMCKWKAETWFIDKQIHSIIEHTEENSAWR